MTPPDADGTDAPEREADALLVDHDGVLTGPGAEQVWRLVHAVRAAGIPTVLVSNAYGFGGEHRVRLDAAFDHLVVSGEVGVPKPHPAIFDVASRRAGVPVDRCLLVDDGPGNVRGAEVVGMQAHLHTDAWTTEAVVRGALGLPPAA